MLTMFEDYKADLISRDKSASTMAAYLRGVEAFAEWFEKTTGEELTPAGFTTLDVADYRDHLSATKSASSVNQALSAISSYAEWAESTGLISDNPVKEVKTIKIEELSPKSLSRNEQNALLRSVRKTQNRRDNAMISLMLNTGIRVGELCALETSDVVLKGRDKHIIIRSGKGRKERVVPLNTAAVKALKTHIAPLPEGKVFAITVRGVAHLCNRYAHDAKIDHLTPHVLRHSFATNLISRGVSLDKIAKLMGHNNVNTTARYTQPSQTDLANAVETINQ